MSRSSNKTLTDFVPLTKQITFSELQKSSGLQQTNISSLMRITDPTQSVGLPLSASTTVKTHYSFPLSQTPSLSTSRRNDTSNNSKRLKLKDYLHLSSIQKKSKKSASSSKIEGDQSIDIKKSFLMQNSSIEPSMQTSYIEPSPRKSMDSSEVLKQDILKRIEQQIRELRDLSSYVQNDFKNHQNPLESQFLLISILNSVLNGSKGYQAIGEQIIEYEKEQSPTNEYYWTARNQGLESPAKMSKKNMEIGMNLVEYLNLKK